jgi:glycosyltransferase involved in cell wall biosynthesis
MHTVLLSDDMAAHYGIDAEAPRVEIIPACCSDRFFEQPLVERRTAFGPERPLRLAGVGMVVDWKGWRTACEAIMALGPDEQSSLRFDHWGPSNDLDLASDLHRMISEAGLEEVIRFHGTTDRVAEVLREADWLLHPAVSDPFPVAVLEALTLGLPVLATSSGGPASMVRSGLSGLHSAPYDAEGLADNLRAVLRGEVAVGSPAEVRESVQPMSASVVARRYAELYRSLSS